MIRSATTPKASGSPISPNSAMSTSASPTRQAGTSHRIYRKPWPGDPRVNIQNRKGMAKPYQVRQVLKAIERMEDERRE